MHLFDGPTADSVWQQAVNQFQSGIGVTRQSSRGGETNELMHCTFSIQDPRQRWVISRQPAMNPAFAIAEVVWIVAGRKDSAFMNFWNPTLPEFAGKGDNYHGAYGFRLRHQAGIDQLLRARDVLEATPDSRQVVLSIWDPKTDLPDERGRPTSEDTPCNICSLLKIREGRLEWLQLLRSNDLFLGVPHNFVQFTIIQEIMAGWLGIQLGTYVHVSDSLHVYVNDLPHINASERITEMPANTDDLCLPFKHSIVAMSAMEYFLEKCARPDSTIECLREALALLDLPLPYRNLASICAADAARRRGWFDHGDQIAHDCTNPILLKLWQRWYARCSNRKVDTRE